jgi:hypothetical protein
MAICAKLNAACHNRNNTYQEHGKSAPDFGLPPSFVQS